MKRSRIKRISPKMLAQKREEISIRKALCERAGGTWIFRSTLTGGYCRGGVCELCHRPAGNEIMRPHEHPHRSQGGKLSLKDSKMSHLICHMKEHHIRAVDSEPQWD